MLLSVSSAKTVRPIWLSSCWCHSLSSALMTLTALVTQLIMKHRWGPVWVLSVCVDELPFTSPTTMVSRNTATTTEQTLQKCVTHIGQRGDVFKLKAHTPGAVLQHLEVWENKCRHKGGWHNQQHKHCTTTDHTVVASRPARSHRRTLPLISCPSAAHMRLDLRRLFVLYGLL